VLRPVANVMGMGFMGNWFVADTKDFFAAVFSMTLK
jgi:hypothetical protein